jgi:hypothetical protein
MAPLSQWVKEPSKVWAIFGINPSLDSPVEVRIPFCSTFNRVVTTPFPPSKEEKGIDTQK